MQMFITVVHVLTCFLLVVVVLMQSGKGAEISATLGGSSQTVFGSTGGANFFQKLTYGLAAVFFLTSMLLTIAGNRLVQKSVFDSMPASSTQPAAPGAAAPAQSAPTAPKTETQATGVQQAAPAAPSSGEKAPAAPQQ